MSCAGGDVEAGVGLIEHQQLRLWERGLGDFESALHSAGKGADAVLGAVGQLGCFEGGVDASVQFSTREAEQVAVMHEVFAGGQLRVEGGRLKDDADRSPHAGRVGDDVRAEHLRGAGGGLHQRREDTEQRALARAVRAEQCEDLAGANLEAHAGEHAAVAVAMADVEDLEGGGHCELRIVDCEMKTQAKRGSIRISQFEIRNPH
ncbi:MAG: hypothetical protein QM770_16860 [Tepidisphaeraceae bacterium]